MKKPDIVLWLLFIVFVVIRVMFKMEYWIVLTAETVGLPFAILQKKRDITSAMISHGLVDAVRFTLLGM